MRGGEVNRELRVYGTGGKEVWFLVGLAPTLLLVLVALRAPLDSIDRIPALTEAIGFFCSYVPSFHGYIQPTPYSQATALYFVCAWALLLPQTAVWLFVIFRYVDLDRLCGAHGKRYFVTLMVVWLLVAGGIFAALYWIPPASAFVDVCLAGWNRIGLAFFCSAGFLFVALGVGFVINAIITLTTISWKTGAVSGV